MMDTCHCCEPGAPPTPATIYNRPGLSSIRYRAGTHGSFMQAMLQDTADRPELHAWTTRSTDDHGILVLDMWAYVGDVLTFYQERIANEAFLRTALHWESVLRLVALLDYKPAPGLAATTLLAFFAEEDAQVLIPVGLRVQSVPGQDEKPQKFETFEALVADATLNERRIFGVPKSRDPLQLGSTYGILHPDHAEALAGVLGAGQSLVLFSPGIGGKVQEKTVTAVEEVGWQMVLRWAPAVQSGMPTGARLSRWRSKLRLFGRNVPEKQFTAALDENTQVFTWSERTTVFNLAELGELDLETHVDDLESGTDVLVVAEGFAHLSKVSEVRQVEATLKDTGNSDIISSTTTRLVLAAALPAQVDLREVVIYVLDGAEIEWWPHAYPEVIQGDTLYVRLDALGDSLLNPEELLDPRAIVLSLKDARKRSDAGEPAEEGDGLALYLMGQFSSTLQSYILAYAGSAPPSDDLLEMLVHALNTVQKQDASLYKADRFAHVELEPTLPKLALLAPGFSGDSRLARLNRLLLEAAFRDAIMQTGQMEHLAAGRRLLLTDRQGLPLDAEVKSVYPMDVITDGRHLVIEISPAPGRSLRGDTAKLFGNVVLATHGETVADEVLGNGDAAEEFQAFTLKKRPVTFVPDAEAPGGSGNTLTVRSDGIAWEEARTLYGQESTAQVFTTEVNERDEMIVRFGDGRTGARLPTGRNNVTAIYRKGLGPEGNVDAGTLKTLLDRPRGLKGVTNFDDARGGADGEELNEARTSAPGSVRIFDRIVSLRDFEDAARAYAGVTKARASWHWDGEQRVVHLVVAGDEGIRIEQQTKKNLVAYLDARRDPNRDMRVAPHRTVPIRVEVAVAVDERHEEETVEDAVRGALLHYFSFDNRDLGESVHLSDIYHVVQSVEGVMAADVNVLQYRRAADQASHGVSSEPLMEHLLLRSDELAAVTNPLNDLTVIFGLDA